MQLDLRNGRAVPISDPLVSNAGATGKVLGKHSYGNCNGMVDAAAEGQSSSYRKDGTVREHQEAASTGKQRHEAEHSKLGELVLDRCGPAGPWLQ